jgi:hypothetical protein
LAGVEEAVHRKDSTLSIIASDPLLLLAPSSGAERPLSVVACSYWPYTLLHLHLLRRVAPETACRVGKLGHAGWCTDGGAFVKNNTEVEEAGRGPGGDPRNILPHAQHCQDRGVDEQYFGGLGARGGLKNYCAERSGSGRN